MKPVIRIVAAVVSISLAAGACQVSVEEFSDQVRSAGELAAEANAEEAASVLAASRCESGLTETGAERLPTADAPLPVYELEVDIEPSTGAVVGSMTVALPAVSGGRMNFRVFPGMEAFDSGLVVDNVTVDGEPTTADLNTALLSVEAPAPGSDLVVVGMDFSYTVAQMAADESLFGALSGSTLEPDTVGLLGRTESGMQLGHWFPVWLPDTSRTDPDPSGFGDIGAFPAAHICAEVVVPAGYTVVTSGSLAERSAGDPLADGASGLRDYAIVVSKDLVERSANVDGVELRVWGPSDDIDSIDTVLAHTVAAQRALVDAFGPYPWRELDVVSTPLGGGVGGMEWPGMVWIERSMFAGGIPGLGAMEGFGGAAGGLEDMFASVGGLAVTTMLEWTIAHELGHEWWHALVGNDSIASPAVDEPLAQFAACVAVRETHPEDWEEICAAQTTDQFGQAMGMGVSDAIAEQPSDAFDNSLQYGAVIYGKAPGFYFEAAEVVGWDRLIASLRSFVEENSFDLVSTEALRRHLIEAAGDDGDTIADLWQRWFRDTKGAEDIEAANPFEMLGDLFGGPDGNGTLNLDELFGDLDGNGTLNLDELFGGSDGGTLNLDELFGAGDGGLDLESLLGEDGAAFEELFEELFGALDE